MARGGKWSKMMNEEPPQSDAHPVDCICVPCRDARRTATGYSYPSDLERARNRGEDV